MEKKMNYGFMLPLKEITLRRVTAILYVHPDILISHGAFDSQELVVKQKMSNLGLPPLITKQMQSLVRPIGTEIGNFIGVLSKCIGASNVCDIRILDKICWTNLGSIDYRKTAEKLIRVEMLQFFVRYKLACAYCLEGYIPVLLENLPIQSKRCSYEEEISRYIGLQKLEFCWPYILKGESDKLDSTIRRSSANPITFNQYAFENSAFSGNKAATEYFFQKLTNAERESSLFKTIQEVLKRRNREDSFPILKIYDPPMEILSDTFCYLLSLMGLEQQMEIFKGQPVEVLTCLLDWPWQDIFMDVAEPIWNFLSSEGYYYLLQKISKRIFLGYPLTKVFQNFFVHGSDDFRKHFVYKECCFGTIFRDLIYLHDTETIKVIFRNIDLVDRKRLVSTEAIFTLFYVSISNDKRNLVELCLQEATLPIHKVRLRKVFFGLLSKIEDNRRKAIISRNKNNPFYAIQSKDEVKNGFKEEFLEFLNEIEAGDSNWIENILAQFFIFIG